MVPDRFSRRGALHLSGLTFLGLAGCSARPPDIGGRDTSTPTASEPEYSHSVDSPESSKVRNPEGEPAVRSSARPPGEGVFESSASWDYEDWLVTSPREADALDFSRATTDVDAATEFVTDTDLSRETLLVHQYNVGECETRRPTRLEWDTELACGGVACTGINLSYRQDTRDSDCQGDDTGNDDGPPYSEGSYDSEVTFVRIPARIQSYGQFGYQF